MWMFLLLPDFSSVAWDSSDSLWDVMTYCLAWPMQKASVLSCGTPGPGLWLPSWQIQVTKSSELPQFRWQNRGRAQTGSVPTGHGWGPNLCPQLLYISTPGLELCCTLTVFKENCWIRWFTALPIRWACHPPRTSATCPTFGVHTAHSGHSRVCELSVGMWEGSLLLLCVPSHLISFRGDWVRGVSNWERTLPVLC